MGRPLLDALRLERMASGHLCLNLSERVGWGGFERYADDLLAAIGGTKVRVLAESVEMRIWEVSVRGQPLKLVYDDYPVGVSLESSEKSGDDELERLLVVLEAHR